MEIFESRDGSHWRGTFRHRYHTQFKPLHRIVFFAWHLLVLLPIALLVLLATALALPVYWLWAWKRHTWPGPLDVHGEVTRIRQDMYISPAFAAGAMDDARPDYSVVMPFYNRQDWVDWSVGSVLRQQLPEGMTAEIIAVDNGSTDDTLRQLQKHPIRVIQCEERGPGAARNTGVAAARAPIVAFTDSDCLADTHWLQNLTEPFEDNEVLITGGRIIAFDQDHFVASFIDHYHILSNERFFEGSAWFPPFFATANAAYRRDALLKTGGFDNNLWMSEDADVAWRVMDLGGKMAYMKNAAVYHLHRKSMKSLLRQSYDYGAASVSIFAKHRCELQASRAINWINIREIARTPVAIIHDIFTGKNACDRHKGFLYALWRLGFTAGSIKECVKKRVLFV